MLPRVIPCLLLRGTGLVKTVKFADPKYVGDAINAVRIFNEKECDELIFLDITATPTGRGPNFDIIRDIASECFMPLCYGGGITSMTQIEQLFKLGCEKVSINSAIYTHQQLIREASQAFGSQSIVAGIDVKRSLLGKAAVYSHSGTQVQKILPQEHARRVQDLGAGEILLNSIDRDGTQKGYDLDLLREVASAVSIPVVACGGAGKLSDFRDAINAGASAVAAGSFFVFHGKHRAVLITYPRRSELLELFATETYT